MLCAHSGVYTLLQGHFVFPFIIQNVVQIKSDQAIDVIDLTVAPATLICTGIKDVATRTAIISVEKYCEEGFS